ncbi:MAG: Cytochrome c4 [Burkholderiaceae bacterium]|jgi:cytochrome c553|nr:MAG: Cytochrome c4 [Burkholderiaceae bacterium]
MNKRSLLSCVAIAVATFAASAQAADPAAGKRQYDATCIACHGPGGVAVAPIYPNLGGQKEEYLAAQLKAFRDGSRPNPIMQPMAKGLSDSEIANLAAYLASLVVH